MAHRNNVVEKIGLRGSHFQLGNKDTLCFDTTSGTSFNNQEKKKQMPNIKEQDAANAVSHDKQNLRASHFTLGNQDPKHFYYTTNSIQLKHYPENEKAMLSEEQKRELRSHHFKMGQYAPTTQTMNNINYDKKPLIEMRDQEKLKLFMRGHHHDFREMPNTVMTTKYNDDYNHQVDQQALKQGIPADQMKEKALALRYSHIVLGKENPKFQSIQKQDYSKKDNQYVPHSKELQRSHFQLGYQKDPMCTTNDIYLNQQPIVTNPLNQETKNDLRASHFTMGQDNLDYKTEFGGNYNKVRGGEHLKQTISTAALQQNHFSLAQDNSKGLNYQTAYSQQMKKPQIDHQGQLRDQSKDRGSNFKIGNQGNSYTSEFTQNYTKWQEKPSQLNEEKKADLRSSHFNFNEIPQNTYQTNYKQSYATKDLYSGKGYLNEEKQSDLRKSHFNIGNQTGTYQTTNLEFHKHPGFPKPPLLNEQKRADLRAHHFKLG